MEPINVGIVGCGFVGLGAHVPAFNDIDGARLVAVADADEGRREKVKRKYGVPTAYDDYAPLVQNPDIQLVVISTPTTLHFPVAMAAIEAGKHVLCEMPLAPSLDQADQMIEAAERQGVCLMPGLNFRFTPNYVKAKELLDRGELGNLMAVIYREWIPAKDLAKQWPPGAWVWNLEESGGPLFTLSVWSIDLLRWLTGSEISDVHAATKYTRLEQFGGTLGYDAFASVHMANGLVGSLQYSGSVNDAATISALELVGDSTQVLSATNNDRVALLGDDPLRTEWNVKQPGAKMWGHQQQNEYLVDCLRTGKQPSITPQDGRRAMEIALAIARAS